ncbi:MAG: RNA methyltransferase [Clostridia bacterium]|nr:RNA methyltransferase [Clostridia bacterium]
MIKEITSKDNQKIKNVVKLVSDKKLRKKEGLFVGEGVVNLREAVSSGADITEIYFSHEHESIVEDISCNEKYLVPEKLIEHMSDVKTPQGVIFVVRQDENAALNEGAILALDNVRDSVNMGTIIRTAEGLGIMNIVLLGDCVDVYNPKTVRATMGSIFRIKPVRMEFDDLRKWADENNMKIYATALSDKATDIREVELSNAVAVIGNEARGVCEEVLNGSDGHIIIPIKSAQSFNASIAAAIVLWEMAR